MVAFEDVNERSTDDSRERELPTFSRTEKFKAHELNNLNVHARTPAIEHERVYASSMVPKYRIDPNFF